MLANAGRLGSIARYPSKPRFRTNETNLHMSTQDDSMLIQEQNGETATVQDSQEFEQAGSVQASNEESEAGLSGNQIQPENRPSQAYLNLGLGPTINASAYIQENRLCVLGVCQTYKNGPIPFAFNCLIEGET